MANDLITPTVGNCPTTNVISYSDYKASKVPLPEGKPEGQKESQPNPDGKQNVYTCVTNKIISDLEKGDLTWLRPWKRKDFGGCVSLPLRSDGQSYRGINVLNLWGAAVDKGYRHPTWMTFKKAKKLGGNVKKGEKGTLVVYTSVLDKVEVDDQEEASVSKIHFLKGYTVFNVEQIDGLPEKFYQTLDHKDDTRPRIAHIEEFIANTKAVIQHGGNRAFYSPSIDKIQMPPIQSFFDLHKYYSVLVHELTHWTGHHSRLNRQFGSRFGNEVYAVEELVAEIGAAFLCARLGITPETQENHAAYIQSWLRVLKKDKRAIFTAASYAQHAVDYLYGLS